MRIIFLAFLGLWTAGPARAETGVTDKEILIGSCSPLSGKVRALGLEMTAGAQALFNDANERGGIHGRRIKFLTFDDAYDPELAIACFKQLTEAGVFASGFFAGAPTTTKYVPMLQTAGLPAVGFSAGSEFITEPVKRYVFNTRASFNEMFAELVDAAWTAGYRRIGIIYQDDAFGAGALRGTKLALVSHGAALAAEGSFSRVNPDTAAALRTVRQERPDAVMVIGFGAPAAAIIKDSRRLGWKPLFMSVTQDPAFLQVGGKEIDGTVMAQAVPDTSQTDLPMVALYRKMLKKYYPEIQPSVIGLSGFAAASVFLEGLKRAGKDLSRDRFVDALESLHDFDVGLGPKFKVRFGPGDHKAFDRGILTVIQDGKLKPLESIPSLKGSR